MAPVVIDLRSAEDSRDVVHRAVQALAEGKIVAFPTETVYALAASALSEDAVRRLLELQGPISSRQGESPALAVKSADDALDYVPDMSALGMRLARPPAPRRFGHCLPIICLPSLTAPRAIWSITVLPPPRATLRMPSKLL